MIGQNYAIIYKEHSGNNSVSFDICYELKQILIHLHMPQKLTIA